MGYAGYVPAKMPTVANDVERAVAAVTSQEALEIIGKLLYNVACSPKEEKFRRIKLTNKTIQSAVVEVPGAVELLLALGWAYEEVEGGEAGAALVIPAGKYMTMKEVRMIEGQKHAAKKEERVAKIEAIKRVGQQQAAPVGLVGLASA